MSVVLAKPTRAQMALGILAGGQARRLGGLDKAMARYRGQTLMARTLSAAGEGFAQVMASYNGANAGSLSDEVWVVPDMRPGYPGPLGGIQSLLATARFDWLLTLPVDLAEIPDGLVERLLAACDGENGVAARDADGSQPLVALWPVASSWSPVVAALDAGERAVHRVQQILGFTTCELAPLRLGNLNTPADFDPAP